MIILSPKTKFLGGALISASHLGKLFPGQLRTWNEESHFLDVNKVHYKVINANTPVVDDSIWVNDTCLNDGYQIGFGPHREFYEYISQYKNVILCNHQPPNRMTEFLYESISTLLHGNTESLTILNYRACWIDEFNMELGSIFPSVKVGLIPYHYYLEYVPEDKQTHKSGIVAIGRGNSRCKIQYQFKYIQEHFGVEQFLPDLNKGNTEFLRDLSNYAYVLGGYYCGGEGNPELNKPYNKLEWNFIDAMLVGCIPLTNTLFKDELERLNIDAPMLGYLNFDGIDNLLNKLYTSTLNIPNQFEKAKATLIREIKKGNYLISKMLS